MKAELALDSSALISDDSALAREIFEKSFSRSENELSRLLPKDFSGLQAQSNDDTSRFVDDDFDWSITLSNVETIVEAAAGNRDALLAAERRAIIAEEKAAEALRWLRTLHDAVSRGLANTR